MLDPGGPLGGEDAHHPGPRSPGPADSAQGPQTAGPKMAPHPTPCGPHPGAHLPLREEGPPSLGPDCEPNGHLATVAASRPGRPGRGRCPPEVLPPARPPRAPPPPAYLPRQALHLEEEEAATPCPQPGGEAACPAPSSCPDPAGLGADTGAALAPVTPNTCQPRTQAWLRPKLPHQPHCRGTRRAAAGRPAPCLLGCVRLRRVEEQESARRWAGGCSRPVVRGREQWRCWPSLCSEGQGRQGRDGVAPGSPYM